jgi:hypothetical protein
MMNALFPPSARPSDYRLYDATQELPIAPALVIAHPPEVLDRIDPPASAGSETTGPIKRKRRYKHDTALIQQVQSAKDLEWQNVYHAMQNAFYKWFEEFDSPFGTKPIPINDFIAYVRSFALFPLHSQFDERLTRFLQAACNHAKVDCPSTISTIVRNCSQNLASKSDSDPYEELEKFTIKFFTDFGIPFDSCHIKDHVYSELSDFAFEFQHSVQSPARFEQDSDRFWGYIQTCAHLLIDDSIPDTDAKPIVLSTLYKIRDALKCSTYKLYKTNETHSGVHLLHMICQALYAEAEVLPAYTLLGQAICEKAFVNESSSLQFSLNTIWQTAFIHGISNNDPKNKDSFWTRITKSCQVLLEGLSIKLDLAIQNSWKSFAGYAAPYKDHHAFFDNNPGVITEEVLSSPKREHRVRTITSASPAFGKQVVPEFLALLQALENHHFYDVSHNSYPYTKIAYTNLQSKKGEIEGVQTQAIMALNAKYPFSFSGITVSQEGIKDERELTEDLVGRIYRKIIADDSFSLRNTPGYYFSPQERKLWSEAIKMIASKCYSCFSARIGSQVVAAYEELLNLGIIRYHEMRTLKNTGPTRSKMLTMRICQAGVDRAGKVNGAMLWGLMETNSTPLITSVIFGRAVLAKGRLPIQDKLKQFENLITFVPRVRVKEFLEYVDELATDKKIRSRSISAVGVNPM